MRQLMPVFAGILFAAAGCMAEGDAPPWHKAGLGGGRVASAVQKAVRETDNDMSMQGDLSDGARRAGARSIPRPD